MNPIRADDPADRTREDADGGVVRLRLDLADDGTGFHGWAAQPRQQLRTVQGVLEDTLSMVLRTDARLTVAGRTDAGVHASGQVAHVDVPRAALDSRSIGGDPARLVRRLSRLLPEDLRVHGCSEAPPGFDARFSALRRRYRYRVTTSPRGALPTRRLDTAHHPRPVDPAVLSEAAGMLVGLHDFAAFCRARPHSTTIRDLQSFTWTDASTEEEPDLYVADVVADAFCWSMVRSLVGSCLAVAEGRRARDFTAAMLGERKRSPMVPVAPAKGLTLTGVDYPAAEELAARAEATRGLRELP